MVENTAQLSPAAQATGRKVVAAATQYIGVVKAYIEECKTYIKTAKLDQASRFTIRTAPLPAEPAQTAAATVVKKQDFEVPGSSTVLSEVSLQEARESISNGIQQPGGSLLTLATLLVKDVVLKNPELQPGRKQLSDLSNQKKEGLLHGIT